MGEMPSGDPYIENILLKVPPEVAKTLTSEQWNGFREALTLSNRRSRHYLDWRFILPFYFVRLYGIFILGRDRRGRVEHVLHERRKMGKKALGAVLLAAGLAVLLSVALAVLYVLKSAAGIDLFPGAHVSDFLG